MSRTMTRSNCDSSSVITRAPIAGGHAPFGLHPSLDEHPLQRGVERAFLHLQYIVRAALDMFRNLVAVQAAADRKSLQDEEVQLSGGISSRSLDVHNGTLNSE